MEPGFFRRRDEVKTLVPPAVLFPIVLAGHRTQPQTETEMETACASGSKCPTLRPPVCPLQRV